MQCQTVGRVSEQTVDKILNRPSALAPRRDDDDYNWLPQFQTLIENKPYKNRATQINLYHAGFNAGSSASCCYS